MTSQNGNETPPRKPRVYLGASAPGTVRYKDMSVEERRAYNRAATKRHRDRMTPEEKTRQQEVSRRWGRKHPQLLLKAVKRKYVKSQFGITLEHYEQLMAGAICAICNGTTKQMHLDHCHATGYVRAPLCNNCNSGLGMFKDNIGYLKRAIAYLEYFQNKILRVS